jgi:hypothetical protein
MLCMTQHNQASQPKTKARANNTHEMILADIKKMGDQQAGQKWTRSFTFYCAALEYAKNMENGLKGQAYLDTLKTEIDQHLLFSADARKQLLKQADEIKKTIIQRLAVPQATVNVHGVLSLQTRGLSTTQQTEAAAKIAATRQFRSAAQTKQEAQNAASASANFAGNSAPANEAVSTATSALKPQTPSAAQKKEAAQTTAQANFAGNSAPASKEAGEAQNVKTAQEQEFAWLPADKNKAYISINAAISYAIDMFVSVIAALRSKASSEIDFHVTAGDNAHEHAANRRAFKEIRRHIPSHFDQQELKRIVTQDADLFNKTLAEWGLELNSNFKTFEKREFGIGVMLKIINPWADTSGDEVVKLLCKDGVEHDSIKSNHFIGYDVTNDKYPVVCRELKPKTITTAQGAQKTVHRRFYVKQVDEPKAEQDLNVYVRNIKKNIIIKPFEALVTHPMFESLVTGNIPYLDLLTEKGAIGNEFYIVATQQASRVACDEHGFTAESTIALKGGMRGGAIQSGKEINITGPMIVWVESSDSPDPICVAYIPMSDFKRPTGSSGDKLTIADQFYKQLEERIAQINKEHRDKHTKLKMITVKIKKRGYGKTITFENVPEDYPLLYLRQRFFDREGIAVHDGTLLRLGKVLAKDSNELLTKTIKDCGIKNGDVIYHV